MEHYVELYKGCYIYGHTKKVFGKPISMYTVESNNVNLYTSNKLEDCYKFWDDFITTFKKKRG